MADDKLGDLTEVARVMKSQFPDWFSMAIIYKGGKLRWISNANNFDQIQFLEAVLEQIKLEGGMRPEGMVN